MYILLRGSTSQRLRLASGLILFAFALTHFLNHALGLVSIDTMTMVQEWRTAVTRSTAGGIILGAALLTHIGLALGKLARRSTLKLPPWELLQIALGLSIPFLLFPHIVNTRVAHTFFGVDDVYIYELIRLWPAKGWTQSLLLLLVWVHACIGLHFWLRLTRWYQRIFPLLFALAVLIPGAAIAGFSVAGREANAAVADPEVFDAIKSFTHWPDNAGNTALAWYGEQTQIWFYLLLAFIVLIMLGRWLAHAMQKRLDVSYVPTPTVRALPGASLLETSRMNGIPHLSVCGGRARCSTCRVEVIDGAEDLAPPNQAEAQTLRSINAGPNVRLACQLRPATPLTVDIILKTGDALGQTTSGEARGVERTLAVLFLDVRGFTSLSEHKLPYDVVFVLNRLFAAAGAEIVRQGGWIDKYLGDGLMAVFGVRTDPEDGCMRALRAARAIDLALDPVNRDMESELGAPLKIGMGLHVGPLVLGEIGHADTAAMTVIGRTVNAASRLESLTKEMGVQLVVSVDAATMAGLPIDRYSPQPVTVRGLAEPVHVIGVERARDLPTDLLRRRSPGQTTAA